MGIDEAEAAIFDAIEQLALQARDATNSGSAVQFARAANALAETRAWLLVPNAGHGRPDGAGDPVDTSG